MSEETLLRFYRLTFVDERDGVMVGRPDAESFAVLPVEGAELLRRLAAGVAPAEAAAWYREEFGEDVDIADFIETLQELEFTRGEDEPLPDLPRVRYRTLGRILFSPPAIAAQLGIAATAAVLTIRHPQLRPSSHNVLFSPSLVLVQVVLFLSQVPALLIHEGYHTLAGRRLGLPTRLRISFRLYFVVFETHLSGLLGVPKKKRYLPFFAGMLADTVIAGSLITLASIDLHHGSLQWPGRLALAIAYTNSLRLIWQLFLFLRTDIYYALTTALSCTNLAEASSAYLKNKLRQLRGKPVATEEYEESWTPRDRAIAPWFAWFSVAGTVVLVALLMFAVIPLLIAFVSHLISGLVHSGVAGGRFWDSAVTLTITSIQFVVLPVLIARRARARLAAGTDAASQ